MFQILSLRNRFNDNPHGSLSNSCQAPYRCPSSACIFCSQESTFAFQGDTFVPHHHTLLLLSRSQSSGDTFQGQPEPAEGSLNPFMPPHSSSGTPGSNNNSGIWGKAERKGIDETLMLMADIWSSEDAVLCSSPATSERAVNMSWLMILFINRMRRSKGWAIILRHKRSQWGGYSLTINFIYEETKFVK